MNPILNFINSFAVYIIAALAAVIVGMSGWVYLLEADLKVEKAERSGIEYALNVQSGMIDANRADYEQNLMDAEKSNTVIQTRYRDRVKVITQWRDANATCDDAMSDFNHYQY